MDSQHFDHQHPLVFNQDESNHLDEAACCSRCGETMSGPSFSCDECGFYLHKECAEAPLQIDHPLHSDHPLCLLPNPPLTYDGGFICNICGKNGEMFVYHCSCDIDLHIKCALFTYKVIAEKSFGIIKGIAYKDSSTSTSISISKCFVCWEPLFDSAYYSLDGGFNVHKKCSELSFEICYPHHSEHHLVLQFAVKKLHCFICHDDKRWGLAYCCSLCNFTVHVACMSPPSSIQGKCHQHPFTLFFRHMLLTCDACGVESNSVPYMCLNCNLLVHKKCISLQPIIKLMLHEHPLSHTFCLDLKPKNWNCGVCLDEVKRKHGSYSCSKCHFIVHVDCVTKRKDWYYAIESAENFDDDSELSNIPMDSYVVIERNEGGDAAKIKHFSHEHNLILTDEISEGNEVCDGCTLPILDSFYYCSECDYLLHKECVEFPRKKHLWFHLCQRLHILVQGFVFKCSFCGVISNGFAYKCHACGKHACIRCAGNSYTLTHEGHEHPVTYTPGSEGTCNACGALERNLHKCKLCEFSLGWCSLLPRRARHKFDEHLLTLTYHDDNTYSEYCYCDVCEKDRNRNHWFYYCAICDTCIHTHCAIGGENYPFMKSGKIYEEGEHQHPLRFVKKLYSYPECFECDNPCQDLALECIEPSCGYIVHWDCILPSQLLED